MNAALSQNSWRNAWKPLLVSVALLFLHLTMLAKLSHDWWEDPNYSHGLLVPFIIGYILWAERDTLLRAAAKPAERFAVVCGAAGIAVALFALWAGTAGAELFTQRMSLVLMIAAVVVYFWGFPMLRLALVPLLLLVLAIPIPNIIFNKIAFPLQLFASRCAVWAMRQFDIPVLRDGNVIELMPLNSIKTKKLEVVEACSGIRSLMTLVTLAVVFAYFTYPAPRKRAVDTGKRLFGWLREYAFWRSALIVLSAVPIAILTNALRVSGTGVLARYYGTEIADGFFHTFSGWVIYILAFLLLFAVGWTLDRSERILRAGSGKGSGGAERATVNGTREAVAATETAGKVAL